MLSGGFYFHLEEYHVLVHASVALELRHLLAECLGMWQDLGRNLSRERLPASRELERCYHVGLRFHLVLSGDPDFPRDDRAHSTGEQRGRHRDGGAPHSGSRRSALQLGLPTHHLPGDRQRARDHAALLGTLLQESDVRIGRWCDLQHDCPDLQHLASVEVHANRLRERHEPVQ